MTFFSPKEIQAVQQKSLIDNTLAQQRPTGAGGDWSGIWDETPEMQRLRKLAEDPSTGVEAADHYARQYQKLLKEQIAYRSS